MKTPIEHLEAENADYRALYQYWLREAGNRLTAQMQLTAERDTAIAFLVDALGKAANAEDLDNRSRIREYVLARIAERVALET